MVLLLAPAASGEVTSIPASADVYMDMNSMEVKGDSGFLRCQARFVTSMAADEPELPEASTGDGSTANISTDTGNNTSANTSTNTSINNDINSSNITTPGVNASAAGPVDAASAPSQTPAAATAPVAKAPRVSQKLSFPYVAMVQFNLSNVTVEDDGVAVLVMKAASIAAEGNQSSIIGVVPAASNWSEESSFAGLVRNWMEILDTLETGGQSKLMSRMGLNTADDKIFAFDVSDSVRAAQGGEISFMVMVISDRTYTIDFKARETGEGPCIVVMPYPSEGFRPTSPRPTGIESPEVEGFAIETPAVIAPASPGPLTLAPSDRPVGSSIDA